MYMCEAYFVSAKIEIIQSVNVFAKKKTANITQYAYKCDMPVLIVFKFTVCKVVTKQCLA